jgi:integrase
MARKTPHICVLANGRRVPFAIKSRPGDPYYFICFRSRDGRRLERSTKETSQNRAMDAAQALIKEEYEPMKSSASITWDDARATLEQRMRENNNKPRTIEDYTDTLELIRRLFPFTLGPVDITLALAKEFKSIYMGKQFSRGKVKEPKMWKGRGRKPNPVAKPVSYSRTARTVSSRLNKLRVIWSKWFIEELACLSENPWESVAPPKVDKLTPRYPTGEEIVALFAWLNERWQGWRLPVLFFTVKSFLGNRIGELCALHTDQLQSGRVIFVADTTKGRKERKSILPAEVFAELQAQAGPIWVWERFPVQLRERLEARETSLGKVNPQFSPNRLKWWLQDELADYYAAHPESRRIKAHDFRRKAMTEAWKLDIPLEKAAIAFGCNPNTMRQHYIALDETEIADEVLGAIAEKMRVADPQKPPSRPEPPDS